MLDNAPAAVGGALLGKMRTLSAPTPFEDLGKGDLDLYSGELHAIETSGRSLGSCGILPA